MTNTFDDRLLAELKREIEQSVAQRPQPALRRFVTPRRVALSLAACGAVALSVGLPGAQGGSVAYAYAVEQHADGSVTVTVRDVTLDQQQQKKLVEKVRATGAGASVQNPPKGYMCMGEEKGKVITNPDARSPWRESKRKPSNPKGDWSVTLRPDDSLVIQNVQESESMKKSAYFFGVRGKVEPCKPVPLGSQGLGGPRGGAFGRAG
ncbi:hypothetical protein ACIQPS_33495 [Streptomyces sp. NPDC091290]|uniref:hypothetical protein n=1 Tax=Streptomyces sp. NPDC091290 TaxID=3365990 RepID=UPI00382CB424